MMEYAYWACKKSPRTIVLLQDEAIKRQEAKIKLLEGPRRPVKNSRQDRKEVNKHK